MPKHACGEQVAWLLAIAITYESGNCQQLETVDGITRNTSATIAEEFRHEANNLQTVMNAFERLASR
jgi:hypothetical protein